MSFDPPVALPAGYVTGQAIAYVTAADHAVLVSTTAPLPVTQTATAATTTPLAGSTAVSTTLGPFTPELGRAIWLTLSGTWTGAAQVLRSTDGGTTKLPLTAAGVPYASFTANVNEAVAEESCAGASWYLAATISSGTLTYRLAQ